MTIKYLLHYRKGLCRLKNEEHSAPGACAFRQKMFCSDASVTVVSLLILLGQNGKFSVLTVSHCLSVLVAVHLRILFSCVFLIKLQLTNYLNIEKYVCQGQTVLTAASCRKKKHWYSVYTSVCHYILLPLILPETCFIEAILNEL